MLQVLFVMSAGVAIGALLHRKERLVRVIDKLVIYAVWLLLFVLGVSVADNKVVVAGMGTLGIKALIIAVCATAFSIALVSGCLWFFSKTHER